MGEANFLYPFTFLSSTTKSLIPNKNANENDSNYASSSTYTTEGSTPSARSLPSNLPYQCYQIAPKPCPGGTNCSLVWYFGTDSPITDAVCKGIVTSSCSDYTPNQFSTIFACKNLCESMLFYFFIFLCSSMLFYAFLFSK